MFANPSENSSMHATVVQSTGVDRPRLEADNINGIEEDAVGGEPQSDQGEAKVLTRLNMVRKQERCKRGRLGMLDCPKCELGELGTEEEPCSPPCS